MSESVEVQIEDQEFQLESDNELRFEVENKNETVVLEVSLIDIYHEKIYLVNNLDVTFQFSILNSQLNYFYQY